MKFVDIRDVIDSVDIADMVTAMSGAEFEERNGELWCLSPLKDENTPSFSVRKETKQFMDFASGQSGGVLDFIQRFYGCSRWQAIEKLKQYAGVEGDLSSRVKLSATDIAKRFSPPKGHVKTGKSSVLSPDYMERYELRPEKLAIWETEGISKASMERFSVRYDSFSDRLVYPIRNMTGDIVNIGGRTLDPDWKAKKLRKYTYFFGWKAQGGINLIYGVSENLSDILAKREIILFEGAKSVMLADTWGIRNTGALLTSHLSEMQMKILIKLGVRAVFALDKDVDVRQDKNIRRLRQYTTVQYLMDGGNLLNEKDAPVDQGRDVFQTLYEGRKTWR